MSNCNLTITDNNRKISFTKVDRDINITSKNRRITIVNKCILDTTDLLGIFDLTFDNTFE